MIEVLQNRGMSLELGVRPGASLEFNDLHPTASSLPSLSPRVRPDEKLDKVTFIFNFFDELHRIAPATKK